MISRVLVVVLLVLLNGFFVAAEFALVRARRTRLEAMTRAGTFGARSALRAVSNLPRLLSASQLGISVASLTLGWVATEGIAGAMAAHAARLPLMVEFSLRATLGATAAVVIVAYVHVVFGELVPRAAALNQPEALARWLAGPMLLFAWLVTPFLWVLTRSAHAALRLMGERTEARDVAHSPDELRLLVEQSGARGALERQDADFIEGVFEFSEKNAREVMTPRTRIVAIPAEATLDEALAAVVEGGFSRYPVYEETIDDIVGLVLAKDLLRAVTERGARPDAPFAVRQIARPVHVVPGTREVEEVLSDFKRLKEHMAIVLDEFGGTAGVVTMEDLLEEIVGEILDEYDDAAAAPLAPNAGGETCVPGSTHVSELNERFGLTVPDDEATTIGGFVFGTLGRLPTVGDRVSAGGAIFVVREMEGRRVRFLDVDLHTLGDRRQGPRQAVDAEPREEA